MYGCSSNKLLDTMTICVKVTAGNAKLNLSPGSMSVAVGETKAIAVTVTGAAAGDYLSANYNEKLVYAWWGGSWNNNTIMLYVKCVATGSSKVEVSIYSATNVQILKASCATSVFRKQNPKITLSQSSISLKTGYSTTMRLSYSGFSGDAQVAYGISNTSVVSCRWPKNSGDELVVSGKNAGTSTVTVYLYQNNVELTRTSFTVTVTTDKKPEVKPSQSTVTLEKNNSQTLKFYYYNITTSIYYTFGLSNETVCSAKWGRGFVNNWHELQLTGKEAGSCTLTVNMHRASDGYKLASCAVKVTVTDNSNPLRHIGFGFHNFSIDPIPEWICLYGMYKGKYAGHSVLCFGYDQPNSTSMNLLIYDSNYSTSPNDMQQTFFQVTRPSSTSAYNRWTYNLTSNTEWGSNHFPSCLEYVRYNTFLNVWSNRGRLNSSGLNLISSTEDTFSLYNFDGELAIRYEDGMVAEKAAKQGPDTSNFPLTTHLCEHSAVFP